ncbi:N-acetyltransferase [Ornithinibacillus halotolerans]|uniref:N-acetyltransferase n=2 Tax=Ornithinibacillus halotolerans TaxID=1274357 RepID=A0A916S6R7_9BACI|nr:N-acetyltransferase [Ornithinibacillus halotolerans]
MDVTNITLSNERIMLRELVESDWIDVHKYASQEIVSQYQAWGPNSTEQSIAYVDQAIKDAKEQPRLRFVFAVIHNNRLVGASELNIRDVTNKVGEVSYIIHPAYWGKGFATEVATLLVDFGFTKLQLHRIYATCDPRNTGSIQVLKKTGMTLEGRIREHMLIKDGWRDSFLYSILEHEWD